MLGTWAACVEYVVARAAEGDERAHNLAALVKDARERNAFPMWEAMTVLPAPLEHEAHRRIWQDTAHN